MTVPRGRRVVLECFDIAFLLIIHPELEEGPKIQWVGEEECSPGYDASISQAESVM